MESSTQCLRLIAVFLTLIGTVSSLTCYTCNSTLDHNCQEKFNYDTEINPLRASECTVWNARYCVKVTGVYGGIVGTHRFCTSRDLGNQCQDVLYPDHDRKYRACVYTCSSDSCNGASSMFHKWTVISTFTFLLVSIFYKLL